MTSRRRPTPRAFAIALAGGLLFIAGTTAQAGWLFVLAAGVVGLVAGSVVVRQNLSSAVVERTVPARARVGGEVKVQLTLRNGGGKRLPMLRMTDRFAALSDASAASDRLAPGESSSVEQIRWTQRRGRYETGAVSLRAGAPFGFIAISRTAEVASPMVIVPSWTELTSFPILEPS